MGLFSFITRNSDCKEIETRLAKITQYLNVLRKLEPQNVGNFWNVPSCIYQEMRVIKGFTDNDGYYKDKMFWYNGCQKTINNILREVFDETIQISQNLDMEFFQDDADIWMEYGA